MYSENDAESFLLKTCLYLQLENSLCPPSSCFQEWVSGLSGPLSMCHTLDAVNHIHCKGHCTEQVFSLVLSLVLKTKTLSYVGVHINYTQYSVVSIFLAASGIVNVHINLFLFPRSLLCIQIVHVCHSLFSIKTSFSLNSFSVCFHFFQKLKQCHTGPKILCCAFLSLLHNNPFTPLNYYCRFYNCILHSALCFLLTLYFL